MKSWALVLELNDDGGDTDRWPIATCGVSNRAGPWRVLEAIEKAEKRTAKEIHATGEDFLAELYLLAACSKAIKENQRRS